jgi:uncharacterized membrane protein YgdD (TMEM256/DUF423 family)
MKLNPAWIIAAALAGALSVALGAAGSHVGGLRNTGFIATASQYGLIHAAALLGLAALAGRLDGLAARLATAAAWLFIAGLVLFSGMLALAAFTGATPLAHLVPLGGIAYMLGWIAVGATAVVARRGAGG